MERSVHRTAVVWLIALAVAAGGAVPGLAADPASLPATVDDAFARGIERVVVRVAVTQPEQVRAIASWVEPWEVDLAAGFLVVDVDVLGYQRLLDLGFEVSLDAKRTEKYNRVLEALPDQAEGIPGYPCYRTVEETLADGQALAAANPGLAEWLDITPVTVGRTMLAVEALNLMERRKITSLVVVTQDRRVEGVVHLHDLWRTELF